jgi:hypothetical protein
MLSAMSGILNAFQFFLPAHLVRFVETRSTNPLPIVWLFARTWPDARTAANRMND